MTIAERAKAAADFLNAGDRWRVQDCTPAWPQCRDIGRWVLASVNMANLYPLDHAEVIALAIKEGWTEANTAPIATEPEAETGADNTKEVK